MSQVTPTLSVVMPVAGDAEYISEAIESILAQSFTDFEFLIINDGCNTQALDTIGTYTDPRITLLHNTSQKNMSRALNFGLERSHAEFIARMDADDIADPKRFETQISFLRQHPEVGICGSWAQLINHQGERCGKLTPDTDHTTLTNKLWSSTPFIHPSVMFARNKCPKIEYDEEWQSSQDLALWWQMFRAGVIFANIPEQLIQYRIHSDSITTTTKENMRHESYMLLKKHLPDLELSYEQYLTLTNRERHLPISDKYRSLREIQKNFKLTHMERTKELILYAALRFAYILGIDVRDRRWAQYSAKKKL